jgi:ribonuclease Z
MYRSQREPDAAADYIAPMLTELQVGPYTVRGISVGGVYTSLQVPELGVVLDAGIPLRTFASTDRIFLSHGHTDHSGGLGALLNIRALTGKGRGQVFLPQESEADVRSLLAAHDRLARGELDVELVPLLPGDERALGHGLSVRAFRTHHAVPSLGYQFLRRVSKLRPEHRALGSEEIARRRREGDATLFEEAEHLELAYATDTRASVLDATPALFESKVLILECTFVGAERTPEEAQRRAHLHLDELATRAERFRNEALVLMHFSQAYSPAQVREAVQARLPAGLRERVHVFAPEATRWFG